MPYTGKEKDEAAGRDGNVAGLVRLEPAFAIGNQENLELGQDPPARPLEVVEPRMPRGRIGFSGRDHRAACPGDVAAPSHRRVVDRQVVVEAVGMRHGFRSPRHGRTGQVLLPTIHIIETLSSSATAQPQDGGRMPGKIAAKQG